MSHISNRPLNFERQKGSQTERRCGAAALCMVLRTFGFEADQQQLWNALRKAPAPGKPFRIETFRLAAYAEEIGLAVRLGRLANPADFVQKLDISKGYQMILNHRIRRESGLGHFTVFEKWEPSLQSVFVHDPQIGPSRKIPLPELLELWTRTAPPCEITGNVAVLFFRKDHDCDRLADPEHWSAFFSSENGRKITGTLIK